MIRYPKLYAFTLHRAISGQHSSLHRQGLHLEGVNDNEALGGAPGGTAGWGNFWDDWTVGDGMQTAALADCERLRF